MTLGITRLHTTQYMEEANELADTVAIIDLGQIPIKGPPPRLKVDLGGESIDLLFGDQEEAVLARAEFGDLGDRLQLDRDMVRLYLNQAAQAIPTVTNRLQMAGIEPVSLTLTQPTLDDVFLQVAGQRLVSGVSPLTETAERTKGLAVLRGLPVLYYSSISFDADVQFAAVCCGRTASPTPARQSSRAAACR